MIRNLLRMWAVIVLLSHVMVAHAQYLEGGIIAGATLYEGELSPESFADKFKKIQFAGGIFVRQNFNEHFSGRVQYQYGTFAASDADRKTDRNLSFQTTIAEFAFIGEYNVLGYDPSAYKRFSPYFYVGIAYLHYNPQAELNGRLVALQPMGTEGQGLNLTPAQSPFADDYASDFYSLDQITIPFGGGLKYALTPSITIGAEFGPRLTFTDYLDDVSGNYARYSDIADNRGTTAANLSDRTGILVDGLPIDRGGTPRGDPKHNDWYFFGNITISYHFFDLFAGGASCPANF